jgi:hypothetical protein
MEDTWERALREVESSERRPGLWARCFAEAGGDESKAKAAYITYIQGGRALEH